MNASFRSNRIAAIPGTRAASPNPGARCRRMGPLVVALVLLIAAACAPAEEPADLVLLNGTVVTMDDERPEVEGVAIRGHTIVATGSSSDIRRFVGDDTEVIDLEGRLAIPGFIEGHGHFMGLGRAKMILDLTQAGTWDEIVALVADAARDAEPGEWITGRGWHQERWDPAPTPTVDGVPLHAELSRVSPDNPVNLTHASGHASFANARAMELAGITRATPNPAGGEIVKDGEGNPTGLLRETAQRLVGQAHSRSQEGRTEAEAAAEFRRQIELAGEEALSKGVTSFHDAGSSFAVIDGLREADARGELPVRLYVMVRGESNERMAELLPEYRTVADENGFLTVRSIKRQIDGALGAHGAWLLEPYEDLPQSAGLTLEEPDDIRRTAEIAVEAGYQLNTHAIGDRANREVLDIYEDVFSRSGNPADHRWRIEHAQHLHPDDIQRFVDLGVIASMQGIHGTSDGPWVLRRLGAERAESGAYLWRALIDAGVIVTNGTDVPVEDIDPVASFHASVSRVMSDGERFYPGQRMSREEALRSYTINNAYAAFEEDTKGSLAPGKLADIAILSSNIMTIPEEEILSARVDYTIVGGEVRFRR